MGQPVRNVFLYLISGVALFLVKKDYVIVVGVLIFFLADEI